MILRHEREQIDELPAENTFEAVDERSGAVLGTCRVYVSENAALFPTRPLRIYMDILGERVPDSLLGASVARAKEIARQSGMPSRVFAQVEPQDSERLTALKVLGFKDNDGLVMMERALDAIDEVKLPLGCVRVVDDLDDPLEQEYFLERYGQLYNEQFDHEWLEEQRAHTGFKRILIVSSTGMLGETILWQEGDHGVITWLHTARRWRRKGVARCLLQLACEELQSRGLKTAQAEVQARIPNLLHVMERSGFKQKKLILRYPGVDVN